MVLALSDGLPRKLLTRNILYTAIHARSACSLSSAVRMW